jgi:hypothetical protein
MKKINLLIVFLASTFATLAQTYTTGTVSLTTTAGLAMSVKIDVATNVTLTLSGPSNRWFALGFNASSMTSGTDVVGVHSVGTLTNFDARLTGFAAPVTDAVQNWTITSDQVVAGNRVIVATRLLNTGDATDYVFTAGPGSLSLIWARGSSNSYSYANHGNSNRGITNVTFSLMPSPPLTVTPTDTTICAGASTTLTASSSQGATFLWSPGGATTASVTVSPTTTTTYSCVATLNGVSSTATSVVNVQAAPVVNQVSSTAYCDSQYVPQTVFSGTAGATYSWTNSNPLNGVQASGTGNVTPYFATVLSNSLETGNITVIPSLNGCAGTPMTFSISLVPTPSAFQFDWDWCHGQTATQVVWQGNYTSIQWTNSNTSIGQVASGSGVLPAFTAINTGTSTIISVVTATPFYSFGGTTCTSSAPPATFEYRIYPVGTINPNPNINVCSGAVIPAVNFTGNTNVFDWTNSNASIGLSGIGTGTGSIPSFTAPTVSSITTATIIVTPRYFTSSNFYCDGVVDTFLITIYPPLTSQTFITSCSPVVWNGNTYTSSGTYSVNLTNANGCDSIANLVLTAVATLVGVDSVTTCTPYLWNGNTYISSGTYSVNLTNANGCDSTANLVLTTGAAQVGGQSVTTCNSYIWNGNTYNSSGIYTDTLIATNGCDSISTLTLTIENPPQPPQVNMISMSDYVELNTQAQPGASYQWVICPTYDSIPGEDSTTMIVINNGNYAVIVTNACGSDTSTCVTVSTFLALDENSKEQQIFPTVLHCNDWLNVPADHWILYDLQGNKMATLSTNVLGIKMSFPSGMYILSNAKKRHKIIVL